MPEETRDSSRKMTALFYAVTLVAGLTLYVAWGLMYNSWNIFSIDHIAIYSFFMVMVGTGAVGMYLYGGNMEIR